MSVTDPQPSFFASSGQELPSGTRLEEFVIERVLGSGGFGITYLARDERLGRKVVIKENLPVQFAFRDPTSLTVSPRHSRGEDTESYRWSLENFEREAATLASLNHHGIVKVLRSFEAFGTACFVMPFVEGVSLGEEIVARRARGGGYAKQEVEDLLRSLLDALGYLHAQGIYHRDLKPGNILIAEDGQPVLIDFGAARQSLGAKSLTVIESPGYTPYEQLQTKGCLGPWSDLYALGATLHKAVCGETPAKSADRFPEDPLSPLAARAGLNGRYGETLLASIDRSLRLRIEDRWQSAGDWRDSLTPLAGIRIVDGPNRRRTEPDDRGVVSQATGTTGRTGEARGRSSEMEGARAGEWWEFGSIEMVWCPPGRFSMGSPRDEEGRQSDERQHEVNLTRGFWVAKYPCTQGQWEKVMEHNPSWFGRLRRALPRMGVAWGMDHRLLPLESVGWAAVHEWLARMNRLHPLPGGWVWDLPSEAQWEYACRAGSTDAIGGSGSLEDMGWHLSNSRGGTQIVGRKEPNAWGLHDMHGNVWELCRDWYAEYPIGPATDPDGPKSGAKRVCRGGSWNTPAYRCQSASRGRSVRSEDPGWGFSGIRLSRMGFRPAAFPPAG